MIRQAVNVNKASSYCTYMTEKGDCRLLRKLHTLPVEHQQRQAYRTLLYITHKVYVVKQPQLRLGLAIKLLAYVSATTLLA